MFQECHTFSCVIYQWGIICAAFLLAAVTIAVPAIGWTKRHARTQESDTGFDSRQWEQAWDADLVARYGDDPQTLAEQRVIRAEEIACQRSCGREWGDDIVVELPKGASRDVVRRAQEIQHYRGINVTVTGDVPPQGRRHL